MADMSQGYFQVCLADGPEGSHITTFLSERGIFRWPCVAISHTGRQRGMLPWGGPVSD